MKFPVTFKDPDVLNDAIREAAEAEVETIEGIDAEERASIVELRRKKLSAMCRKWFKYGEYVTIEIDSEAESATVVPVSR